MSVEVELSEPRKAWFEEVITGYTETAIWVASCNGQAQHDECRGEDCDAGLDDIGYEVTHVSATTRKAITQEVTDFVTGCEQERPDVFDGMRPDLIGHDFLLTRNGHGVGFWDRGYGERGDWLSKQSHPYGTWDLYVGDDGELHGD
jgi:hypothetical protein